jgi:hypothetical protein
LQINTLDSTHCVTIVILGGHFLENNYHVGDIIMQPLVNARLFLQQTLLYGCKIVLYSKQNNECEMILTKLRYRTF